MAEYIDREALIKIRHGCDRRRKCEECDFAQEGDSWCNGELFVVDVLRQPAADVKPVVHGKWIYDDKQVPLDEMGCPTGSCWCSECGDWLSASDEYSVRGYFCPNCGADMREQEPKPEPAPGPYDLLHEEGGWNLQ